MSLIPENCGEVSNDVRSRPMKVFVGRSLNSNVDISALCAPFREMESVVVKSEEGGYGPGSKARYRIGIAATQFLEYSES